ncbi:unnamed protein product [Protopolystoma xenopodis]|uniref:Uncharacterized protein n=1 Tax=Protopolystoma xenopodis TaxID=117903 RepID=A0A3S5CNB7_9PLAT|nr:unnamed protein product [Protopolystoma xenopodis]
MLRESDSTLEELLQSLTNIGLLLCELTEADEKYEADKSPVLANLTARHEQMKQTSERLVMLAKEAAGRLSERLSSLQATTRSRNRLSGWLSEQEYRFREGLKVETRPAIEDRRRRYDKSPDFDVPSGGSVANAAWLHDYEPESYYLFEYHKNEVAKWEVSLTANFPHAITPFFCNCL